MSYLKALLESIKSEMPIIMALFGGMARVILHPLPGSAITVIARAAASAFAGFIVYLILQEHTNLSQNLQSAIIGVAGYAGVDLLDILSSRLMRLSENKQPKDKL